MLYFLATKCDEINRDNNLKFMEETSHNQPYANSLTRSFVRRVLFQGTLIVQGFVKYQIEIDAARKKDY